MVDVHFEDIDSIDINVELISEWIENIVEGENKTQGDLCFIFCSDNYLLKINQEYLNHDYLTDVITFDYSQFPVISGDIFISIDRIRDNSEQFKVMFFKELLRVISHGVLHLLGYKDKTTKDKNLMTSKEDECLKKYSDVERV